MPRELKPQACNPMSALFMVGLPPAGAIHRVASRAGTIQAIFPAQDVVTT